MTFAEQISVRLVFTVLAGMALVVMFLRRKTKKEKPKELSAREKRKIVLDNNAKLLNERLNNFKPDNLTEPLTVYDNLNLSFVDKYTITSKPGHTINIRSKDGTSKSLLNFGSIDFFGFSTDIDIVGQPLKEALEKYGVGSCGPRTFYGTFDAHLILEQKLAEWMGTEGCVVYSDSFSTIPGVLGSFVTKNDVVFLDEGCHQGILNGIRLTRCQVELFSHLDARDCENKMRERSLKKSEKTRFFIVTESIFRTTGKKTDLTKFIPLREKHRARLLVDESLGLGICGATGRGLFEEQGLRADQIDFICGSLDNAFATVGGFSCGALTCTDVQRLAGGGYIYSAAVAPSLSVTAAVALAKMRENPDLTAKLRNIVKLFREMFNNDGNVAKKFKIECTEESPLIHILLKSSDDKLVQYRKVREVCERMMQEFGVFVVASVQTPAEQAKDWIHPSIRLALSINHTQQDLSKLIEALAQVEV